MFRMTERTTRHSTPGNHTYRPKEEATLRRVLGSVAWTGLVTAGLLWAGPGQAAEAVRTRPVETGSEPAAAPQTARQYYSAGRELYWQARYGEAVAAFEAAARAETRAGGDLTPAERDRMQEFVQRARAKAPGESPRGVVVRGQSDDESSAGERPASKTGEARKLLAEARRQFNAGMIVEAEKLAQNCKKLGAHWKMFGDSPERLLEQIKEYRKQEGAWKEDHTTTDARRNRSNYLLTRARQVLEEGDVATADRLVREAEQIKVKRDMRDLKPEQLRQQLARVPGSAWNWPSSWRQAVPISF